MSVALLLDARHSAAINDVIKDADEIVICTAFLHVQGLEAVQSRLRDAAKRKARIRIYVGLSECFTHPDALTDLYRLLQPSGQLFLCDPPYIFHPKIYCGVKAGKYSMVIGSANLTGRGLTRNKEASILQQGKTKSSEFIQLESYISDIEGADWTKKASLLKISRYQVKYDIRRRADRERDEKVKEAEEVADAEIVINEELLAEYLERYRTANEDEEGASDWTARESDYRAAKKVLRRMARARYQSRGAFLKDYEELVGKKGERGLWYSGGLSRQKNRVAKRYLRMTALIRFAFVDHAGEIDVVFDEMIEMAKGIYGLGPNVVTEILNTLDPTRYPVLNANPIEGLE